MRGRKGISELAVSLVSQPLSLAFGRAVENLYGGEKGSLLGCPDWRLLMGKLEAANQKGASCVIGWGAHLAFSG